MQLYDMHEGARGKGPRQARWARKTAGGRKGGIGPGEKMGCGGGAGAAADEMGARMGAEKRVPLGGCMNKRGRGGGQSGTGMGGRRDAGQEGMWGNRRRAVWDGWAHRAQRTAAHSRSGGKGALGE